MWVRGLIYYGTGSEEGGTDWYLVVLGQYGVVLVDICCYWVSRRRFRLILGGTESVDSGNRLPDVIGATTN